MFSILLMIMKGKVGCIEDCLSWTSEVDVFHKGEWDLKSVYAHWSGFLKSFNYRELAVLVATKKGEEMWVKREKVSYIAAKGRQMTIYSEEGNFCFNGSLKDISDSLEILGFVRISKRFLVSLDHVEKVEKGFVKMKNGDLLKISRKYVNLKLFYLN